MKIVRLMVLMVLALGLMGFTSVKSNGGSGSGDSLAIVTIAGTKWTTANLTAVAGATSGHTIGAPEDYGSYFKWGSKYTYDNTNTGEGWGEYTIGAAANPTSSLTNKFGYDYIDLSGGTAYPGDPCRSLGANYKTPTRAQWNALVGEGNKWGRYKGVRGYFFGHKAAKCNNTTIQDGCIFLPASGHRYWYDGSQHSQGDNGYYWLSSVLGSGNGYNCIFHSGGVYPGDYCFRGFGSSVRCVVD